MLIETRNTSHLKCIFTLAIVVAYQMYGSWEFLSIKCWWAVIHSKPRTIENWSKRCCMQISVYQITFQKVAHNHEEKGYAWNGVLTCLCIGFNRCQGLVAKDVGTRAITGFFGPRNVSSLAETLPHRAIQFSTLTIIYGCFCSKDIPTDQQEESEVEMAVLNQ